MPVWYTGVRTNTTPSESCGLFDVAHMGVFEIKALMLRVPDLVCTNYVRLVCTG